MTDSSAYTPPKVWKWDKESGGRFANINRPVAGSTHDKSLPVGEHALQLYSLATPNGVKVTVLLEELLELGITDAEYDAYLINIGEGDQFGSDFVAINPNSKIPALLDRSTTPPTRIFESGAILVYLAEKYGAFLPSDAPLRAECMSWAVLANGIRAVPGRWFRAFLRLRTRPDRVLYRSLRHGGQASAGRSRPAPGGNTYLCGEDYTVADMANYAWYGALLLHNIYDATEFLDVASYTNAMRWANAIEERPAVQRGRRVNKAWGPEELQVRERHNASDF